MILLCRLIAVRFIVSTHILAYIGNLVVIFGVRREGKVFCCLSLVLLLSINL